MTRRALAVLGVIAVLALAGFGVWRAGQEPAGTIAERTEEIAAQLACPTCDGQSVAMSHSEIAGAMRTEIRAQLVAGREPSQIRAWFAERYGPEVLLEPPHSGIALVAGGHLPCSWAPGSSSWSRSCAGAARPQAAGQGCPPGAGWSCRPPSWPWPQPSPPARSPSRGDPDGTGSELPAPAARAVAENPTDPEAWAALGAALESDGDYARSAEAYRLAADLQLYWRAYPQRLRSRKYWDRVRGCGGRAHVALDFGETHPPEDFANAAAGTPEFERTTLGLLDPSHDDEHGPAAAVEEGGFREVDDDAVLRVVRDRDEDVQQLWSVAEVDLPAQPHGRSLRMTFDHELEHLGVVSGHDLSSVVAVLRSLALRLRATTSS